MKSLLLLALVAMLLAGCRGLPPLPLGLRIQQGDGSRACLQLPEPDGRCLTAEGIYLPDKRLVITRTPLAYTLVHELCHAVQHQQVIEQWGENANFWDWPKTPQGQALRAVYRVQGDLFEEGADVCAHYLLGLPLEPGEELWAERWLSPAQ